MQLISNVAGGSGSTSLSQYGYTYNSAIDITTWTQQVNGGTTNSIALGYDLCDQLLSASAASFWNFTYGYDNAANQTSAYNGSTTTTATPNDLNQITALSGGTTATLTYDANGNLTAQNTYPKYSWDAENRLVEVQYSSNSNSAFTYDPMGGLVKIVETVGGSVTSTKQFVRTSSEILEERDAGSAVQAQFFDWGQTRSGSNYYYTADHLGSVRDVTNSSGSTQVQYSYDPYGNATHTGSGTQSDFQCAGYYYHAPSGLNLTVNRAYSPSLGRFINRDPIEEDGGVNLYSYVNNNPIGEIDPSGLEAPFMGRDASGDLQGGNVGDIVNDALTSQTGSDVVNGLAGFGDTVSMGATAAIRDVIGDGSVIDTTSSSYGIGTAIGRIGLASGAFKAVVKIRKGPEPKIGNNIRIAPF